MLLEMLSSTADVVQGFTLYHHTACAAMYGVLRVVLTSRSTRRMALQNRAIGSWRLGDSDNSSGADMLQYNAARDPTQPDVRPPSPCCPRPPRHVTSALCLQRTQVRYGATEGSTL